MGHIIADLKETFRRGNIFIQLIYINVGIFVIGTLIHVFLRLFEVNTLDIFNIFALPASLCRVYPSTVVVVYLYVYACRYSAHSIQYALAILVRGVYFFIFSAKHLRGLYILGGICGGLLYMVAYNVFPLFSSQVTGATLVGGFRFRTGYRSGYGLS